MTNLGMVIKAYQAVNDVSNPAVAKKIGIGESTLSRLKAGRMVDAAAFVKIVTWLVSERTSL